MRALSEYIVVFVMKIYVLTCTIKMLPVVKDKKKKKPMTAANISVFNKIRSYCYKHICQAFEFLLLLSIISSPFLLG